jgi:hypothetical protein
MMKIYNVYFLCTFATLGEMILYPFSNTRWRAEINAVLGGGLFGFDISSMSGVYSQQIISPS